MAITAAKSGKLAALVQPEKLAAKGFKGPKQVLVTAGTDHSGADAYFVYLVYPDHTPDTDLAWDKVKPMVQWVQDQLWKADGARHWPYIHVTRRDDLPRWLG